MLYCTYTRPLEPPTILSGTQEFLFVLKLQLPVIRVFLTKPICYTHKSLGNNGGGVQFKLNGLNFQGLEGARSQRLSPSCSVPMRPPIAPGTTFERPRRSPSPPSSARRSAAPRPLSVKYWAAFEGIQKAPSKGYIRLL